MRMRSPVQCQWDGIEAGQTAESYRSIKLRQSQTNVACVPIFCLPQQHALV